MEAEIDSGRGQSVGTREIRFAVEGSLDGSPLFKGQSARDRAIDLFSQLRMWDTRHNTGVLIYLLLADRDVEIVADRGIGAGVGSQAWGEMRRQMEAAVRQSNFDGGGVSGVQSVTQHLVQRFLLTATTRKNCRTSRWRCKAGVPSRAMVCD